MGSGFDLIVKCLVITIVIMIFLHPRASQGMELDPFYFVLMSEESVKAKKFELVEVPSGIRQSMYCSITCIKTVWCRLWCHFSKTECIMSKTYVVANYAGTNMVDALDCFTRRSSDLATGASISSGLHFGVRSKENLVDGIYDYDLDHCFMSVADDENVWFVIDLGENRIIHFVKLYAQSNSRASSVFDIDVRVGTSIVNDPPEGLLNYKEFAFYPGPASRDQEIVLKATEPVTARFVSVQKVTSDSAAGLQICHIEIR